ncbi:SCO family protein [Aidingimonas halophila]|uniref:SCO family protein n=1 Tax=Aidingimonas halophila TaxID=574349 RepID=UPI0027E592E1|nr:SCO family protein [Aidingimonas halophila]
MAIYKWCLITFSILWLAGCSDQSWRTTSISDIMPDLDFELVDENGEAVTDDEYLGNPTLLYFGFTYCPDVCPNTLSRLATAIGQLDAEVRDDIRVLFVSVDPGRDTPEVLSRYTDAFGPQFIGLSGDNSALDAVTKRYRVTYSYGEEDSDGNYDVTHSSAVFAFDQNGEAQFMIRDTDSMQDIVSDLDQLVAEE